MKFQNFRLLPRGPRQCQGETAFSKGKAKSVLRFIVGGILVGFFLISPVETKASCQGYQEPQYEDGIPREIRIYCELVGNEYAICPELLEAMAYNESRFIPEVTNKKCYGLLQINVKVHEARIEKHGWTSDDMFDAYKNITIAADYLAELYETYGDDNPIVLSVYSGNWDAVSKYKESGYMTPYVKDVLARSAEYERLHGK